MEIVIAIILFVFVIFCFISAGKSSSSNNNTVDADDAIKQYNEREAEGSNLLAKCRQNYESAHKSVRLPVGCKKTSVETSVFGLPLKANDRQERYRNTFFIWAEKNTLHLFPTDATINWMSKRTAFLTLEEKPIQCDDIHLISIPFDSIEYYNVTGEKRTETKVQSKNAGVNVKGAIIGGAIAGDAGAVLGGMHNKNTIDSKTKQIDERTVDVFYKAQGQVKKLKLGISAYPLFEEWIPAKEYSYYIASAQTSSADTKNEFDAIKNYKELLDAGIITQEEFDKKKKELLGV